MTDWLLVPHIALLVAFIAGIVMLGMLLRQRRSPQSALAWLGFAMMVPYLAIPLFLILGWRKLRTATPVGAVESDRSDAPLDRLLASYALAPRRTGNQLELLTTGETAHAALIDLIEGARECIDMEIFILHPDPVGSEVLARLARRASEGIRVRLLLDGLGSFTTWPWKLRSLASAGAEIAFFHPLFRPTWWRRANLRNHRKIVLADSTSVLAGGLNIATEYVGPRPDPGRWTDLAFLAKGPIVADYQGVVDADWSYATGRAAPTRSVPLEPPEAAGDADLQLVPSGPDVAEDVFGAALLQSIYGARERISIATPYFVPDAGVAEALALAARRGVDTHLIVPASSNHRFADWARGPYLRELERQGARVSLFERGMLHAKAILVDGVAILGSANVDLRSLYLDYETMMIVYDAASVERVEAWMLGLLEAATQERREPGRLQEVFEGAVRLLAPLL